MEYSSKRIEIKKIPKDWMVVRLGEKCEFLDSKRVPIKEQDRTKRRGSYPYYEAQGIIDCIDDYIFDGEYILLAEDGENLHSKKLPLAYKVTGKFWVNNHAHVLKVKNNGIIDKYLLYVLNFIDIRTYIVGSAQPKLNQSDAIKIEIPLPPLPEQRRIAEVLGTVDSAIQKVGGAIERTERLKKGLMQRLLTRGIGHERFKFSKELDCEIPEEWEVMNLGRATEIIMGQSPPGDTYNTVMNGIQLINGPAEFGEKYPKPNKWTSEPTKITKKNDVLICVRGHTTGRLNISDKELCIGRGVAAIRNLPDATNNIFLYYILDWMRNKIFGISYAAGSTFPNITSGQLNELNIPLPPLPEQRRIAEILSAADRKLELERRRKEKLEKIKKGLMNELLTGRRRVMAEMG